MKGSKYEHYHKALPHMNNCQTVIFEKMKVVALVRIGLAYAVVSTLHTHWTSQSRSSFLTHSVSAMDLVSLQKS